ncbi:MAG: DUF1292 domain-containing protein [Acidaminococcaceae bacterium]|jgi:uncharacterized protein YrzB (UPF0473 family)|nr:DUF1292 domain-containing protein [Acidaminococcaceae bacterium]
MTDEVKNLTENSEETEDQIVVLQDNEGKDNYFRIDVVYPVAAKTYAVLAPVDPETGEDMGCGCGCEGHEHEHADAEGDAFIVKVDFDEKGEEGFVVPTEAEFKEATAAYEKLFAEEHAEEV